MCRHCEGFDDEAERAALEAAFSAIQKTSRAKPAAAPVREEHALLNRATTTDVAKATVVR